MGEHLRAARSTPLTSVPLRLRRSSTVTRWASTRKQACLRDTRGSSGELAPRRPADEEVPGGSSYPRAAVADPETRRPRRLARRRHDPRRGARAGQRLVRRAGLAAGARVLADRGRTPSRSATAVRLHRARRERAARAAVQIEHPERPPRRALLEAVLERGSPTRASWAGRAPTKPAASRSPRRRAAELLGLLRAPRASTRSSMSLSICTIHVRSRRAGRHADMVSSSARTGRPQWGVGRRALGEGRGARLAEAHRARRPRRALVGARTRKNTSSLRAEPDAVAVGETTAPTVSRPLTRERCGCRRSTGEAPARHHDLRVPATAAGSSVVMWRSGAAPMIVSPTARSNS